MDISYNGTVFYEKITWNGEWAAENYYDYGIGDSSLMSEDIQIV